MTRFGHWRWLVAGLAGGYCLAILQQYIQERDNTPQTTQPGVSQQAPANTALTSASLSSAAVTVAVEYAGAGEFVRTAGLLLGPQRHLLIAVAPIRDARAAYLEMPGGRREPAGEVLAADFDLGLALLTTGLGEGISFTPSPASGTLYIGRDFIWESAQRPGAGFVDSPARQTGSGHYVYAVRLNGPIPAVPAALLENKGGPLIGVILPAGQEAGVTPTGQEPALAVDAATVRGLLEETGAFEPMPLPVFASYYANATDAGRYEKLVNMINAGDWPGAVAMAESMMGYGPPDEPTATLFEAAFVGLAKQLLAGGQADVALLTLHKARQLLGNSATRMALRADLHRALEQPAEALEWYALALRTDATLEQSLRGPLRDYVLWLANRPSNSSAASVALLRNAIQDDPDFAPYHARLGQLLFQSGNYAAAEAALSRAIALDGALAEELSASLTSARQKRSLPRSAEAPIDTRGSAIFVNVVLNGSAQPYRFLLDTGASYTAISVETALRLGISNTFFGAPVAALETANGRIYATVTKLESVAVGEARVNDVEVVILDTVSGADGLLGLSFLDHFNVDINQSTSKISLVRR